MKKKLYDYISKIEKIIKNNNLPTDICNELTTEISFYQHERLVHLIVTLAAILCILFFISFLALKINFLFIIFLILFLLFVPYILHYYYLENGVQRLYELYDEIKKTTKK